MFLIETSPDYEQSISYTVNVDNTDGVEHLLSEFALLELSLTLCLLQIRQWFVCSSGGNMELL